MTSADLLKLAGYVTIATLADWPAVTLHWHDIAASTK